MKVPNPFALSPAVFWIAVFSIGIFLLTICSPVISAVVAYTTAEEVTFTVTDKERIVRGAGSSMSSAYLVFTDSGVYENTDTLWYFKFNSSDIYGELEVGKEYTAKVYGFRVPFFSWYKNIVEVKQN